MYKPRCELNSIGGYILVLTVKALVDNAGADNAGGLRRHCQYSILRWSAVVE